MTFVQTGTYLKPSLARGNQMEGGFFFFTESETDFSSCLQNETPSMQHVFSLKCKTSYSHIKKLQFLLVCMKVFSESQ